MEERREERNGEGEGGREKWRERKGGGSEWMNEN